MTTDNNQKIPSDRFAFHGPEPVGYLQGDETPLEIRAKIKQMAYSSSIAARVLEMSRRFGLDGEGTMAVLAHSALVALRDQHEAFVDCLLRSLQHPVVNITE